MSTKRVYYFLVGLLMLSSNLRAAFEDDVSGEIQPIEAETHLTTETTPGRYTYICMYVGTVAARGSVQLRGIFLQK